MKRLGSEIPLFVDRIGPPQPWQDNWLAFSNGRAALAWLLDKWAIESVAICAYTCPSIPKFLRNRGLEVKFYDVGADTESEECAIVPALFGSNPIGKHGATLLVIDAAQTAFGHIDFDPPDDGAVISCPRKCTEMSDGAILALANWDLPDPRNEIATLPIAENAASAKIIARAMMDRPSCDRLHWNKYSERKWPETPHRMSDPSRVMLERLDRNWHREKRQENLYCLWRRLCFPSQFRIWQIAAPAPFCLPIFVANPDEVVAECKSQNIFLTRLWPDAEHNPALHPNAAWMAKHLVSLPVDQRHDTADMERIATAVLAVAKPPLDAPEGMRRFVA